MPDGRLLRSGAWLATSAVVAAMTATAVPAQPGPTGDDWIDLFNGADLTGWTPKIRYAEAGENVGDTFRVEDGLLTVSYNGYESFDNRFGHLFYNEPFSHYRLRLEYRFVGEQAGGGADWALRNSGVMLHSQAPGTMPAAQDFPVSIEVQFLGGLGDGNPRPTGNLCTPGTNVVYAGEFTTEHCIESGSPTFDGEQWVSVEVLVLGSERIVHYIDGEPVIEYEQPTYGGGAVSGQRPGLVPDGAELGEGYIALQSESHPVQFRRVQLLNLKGCMDPASPRYRAWFVAADARACD